MSSSGATGGDQCNRRRLREQPHLKVIPTDARQKSAGTRQGRPDGEDSSQPQWKSILQLTPQCLGISAAQTGWGGN